MQKGFRKKYIILCELYPFRHICAKWHLWYVTAKTKKVYAIKRRKKFKQDTQLIQINMTLVLDIHRMSVKIEQAIFTVSIMDNTKNNKTTTKIKKTT